MSDPDPAATTVLVVEDDPAIREGLVDALGFGGHRVLQAADAPAGTDAALRSRCDLVLLDLMLPGGDGFEVLTEIRRLKPALPVIILTARGREADRVRGLRMGADDYVVKPFSVRELLARVEAVLRRCAAAAPAQAPDLRLVPIPGGTIDLLRREVRFDDGAREELSEREQALLAHLAHHAQRAVSRDELLREVWRVDPARVQTRTVDMHVARLRDKLRDAADPRVILTVRGKGYMLGRGSAPP
ncbi:MAG: response regulator transcription factor [Myxococcales bacterium]|nr:response regulator transcription factor [Myxococcales bacterium]